MYLRANNTGSFFIVDKTDMNRVLQYTWTENSQGYIETRMNINRKRKRIFLHRFLCGVIHEDWRKKQVDHINHNTQDNRRDNLRVCSNAENQMNKPKPRKDNTSGTTGVYYDKRWRGAWIAHIGVNGKNIVVGRFGNKIDAINARKLAESQYYKCAR